MHSGVNLTSSASHDIQYLVIPVIRSRDRIHGPWIVADYNNLTTSRVHFAIGDSTQLFRGYSGAIDDNVSFLSGVVGVGSLRDVRERGAFEDCTLLKTLSNEPRQIHRCVDAHRRELLCIVDSRSQLFSGDRLELLVVSIAFSKSERGTYIGNNVLVPRIWLHQRCKESTSGRLFVFQPILNDSI